MENHNHRQKARGQNSLKLTAALTLQSSGISCPTFACADLRLNTAADTEGLVPP
jgi:hypothetical protein